MGPLPEVQCEAHAEWEQGWEKQDLPVRLISHVSTQLENRQNSNFVYWYHQKKKKSYCKMDTPCCKLLKCSISRSIFGQQLCCIPDVYFLIKNWCCIPNNVIKCILFFFWRSHDWAASHYLWKKAYGAKMREVITQPQALKQIRLRVELCLWLTELIEMC